MEDNFHETEHLPQEKLMQLIKKNDHAILKFVMIYSYILLTATALVLSWGNLSGLSYQRILPLRLGFAVASPANTKRFTTRLSNQSFGIVWLHAYRAWFRFMHLACFRNYILHITDTPIFPARTPKFPLVETPQYHEQRN